MQVMSSPGRVRLPKNTYEEVEDVITQEDIELAEMHFVSEIGTAIQYLVSYMASNTKEGVIEKVDSDYLGQETYQMIVQELEEYK